MANYFSYFPATIHDAKRDGTLVAVTNILKRFIVKDHVANRLDMYHEYNIQNILRKRYRILQDDIFEVLIIS